MKHLIAILSLIPTLAFGAYTEWYCQSGGSNLNSGSTTSNTALYTSTGGNWVQSTRVFTPTDGVNPVSAGVTTSMWASVYVTSGATVATYIGKISAVTNATNGTITIDSVLNSAVPPANGTGTITIKVGGAWQGPNGTSGFPLTFAANRGLQTTGTAMRVNLSDAASYSVTAAIAGVANSTIFQGYHTTPGDGFRATIDHGTTVTTNNVVTGGGNRFVDLIFSSSATSGTGTGVNMTAASSSALYRCVVKGSRGIGVNITSAGTVIETEIYDFNKSNTAQTPGISAQGPAVVINNYIHDASAGANCVGIVMSLGDGTQCVVGNIIESLGGDGIVVGGNSINSNMSHMILNNSIYNCRNGIFVNALAGAYFLVIQNNALVKNSAYGIEGNSTTVNMWLFGELKNNAYGSGTQANASGDYHDTGSLVLDDSTGNNSRVVLAANVTPWTAPTTGNFTTILGSVVSAGRQVFTQTDGVNSGTIGYPDIGVAAAAKGIGVNTEVSYGFAY